MERRGQTVRGCIGDLDGLVLGGELEDRSDRTEDLTVDKERVAKNSVSCASQAEGIGETHLFSTDGRRGAHVGEDGRLDKETFAFSPWERLLT